jgi:hypothetical protein
MLVLGHIAAAGVTSRWFDKRADLRWVVFFGILADLIDKPIGLILFRDSLNNGRVYCHSLLVNILLTVILVALHKPLVYSLALWVHQGVDLMWTRPWVALWPFTGTFGYREMELEQWVSLTLSPYHLIAEAACFVLIACFVFRHKLFEPKHLSAWILSGILVSYPVPIGHEIGGERRSDSGKDAGQLAC